MEDFIQDFLDIGIFLWRLLKECRLETQNTKYKKKISSKQLNE